MDGILQRVISIIIAVVIFFILPIYIAYEKKDDISYSLALKITTDFVENVKSKGYISSDMYSEFVKQLAVTDNSYDIYLEHTAKKYNPVIYSYTDDLKTIRAKFDYNLYREEYETGQIVISSGNNAGTYKNLVLAYDLSERVYTQDQILATIGATQNVLADVNNLENYKNIDYKALPSTSNFYKINGLNTNIYTMNEGDEFSVIIKNRNITMASTIFNVVTFGAGGANKTKVYVNYGGTIKAETYRDKMVNDDTANNNDKTIANTSELVNSYITKGLVTLLNGEYNSGTNHSNSSEVWSDLSGNENNAMLNDFEFNDESGWIYNGLQFTGKEYVSLPEMDLSEMTIEIVVKFDSVTDVDTPEQTLLSNMNQGGAGLVFNQLNSTEVLKRGKVSFDVYGQNEDEVLPSSVIGDTVIQANKVYSIAGSFGKIALDENESDDGSKYITTAQLLSINGKVVGKDFLDTYVQPATGTTFAIGGSPLAGAGAQTQFKGTVYSIRIYNRALNEEELKENYEIDKAKYGIE